MKKIVRLLDFVWSVPLFLLVFLFVFGIFISKKERYLENKKLSILESDIEIVETDIETREEIKEVKTIKVNEYIKEDGIYTSKEEVSLYISRYKKLPNNYLSKKEASLAGWEVEKNNLDVVLPGMSIGGDEFGNYENRLPKKQGRKYYEADIDYEGGARNLKRIIYSSDGLIFYTDDLYETFEQIKIK